MRWTIWKNRPVFGFYLGVLTCFNVFSPILDNRTTTFWIEGYGQIYGVSSAAGGALGHVRVDPQITMAVSIRNGLLTWMIWGNPILLNLHIDSI